MKGISTIIATIIMVVITIGLISVAYLYMSGLVTSRTGTNLQLVDAYCRSGNFTLLIKNAGTIDLSGTTGSSGIGPLTIVIRGTTTTGGWWCDFNPVNTIKAGNVTLCKNNTPISPASAVVAGANDIRIIGPSNAIPGTLFC